MYANLGLMVNSIIDLKRLEDILKIEGLSAKILFVATKDIARENWNISDDKKEKICAKSTRGIHYAILNDDDNLPRINLLKLNNHYDEVYDTKYFLHKAWCLDCRHWINVSDDMTHWEICKLCPKCKRNITEGSEHIRVCTGNKRKYTTIGEGKKSLFKFQEKVDDEIIYKHIKTYKTSELDLSWQNNIHFADFETFFKKGDVSRKYEVYATGLLSLVKHNDNDSRKVKKNAEFPWTLQRFAVNIEGQDKPVIIEEAENLGQRGFSSLRININKNCMEQFMESLMTLKGVLFFWNGSAFDAFFIIQFMLKNADKYPLDEKSVIINNNRLISFKIHKNLVCRDLMLYMSPCSLRNACKSYEVPKDYQKGDFDHDLVRSHKDASRYYKTVEEYLSNDVISMYFIYRNYSKSIYKNFKANITSGITISHLAYQIWSDMTFKIKKGLRIYNVPIDLYRKLIPGYFGGRVFLHTPAYVSPQFEEIQKYIMNDADYSQGNIPEHMFEKIDHWLDKFDVCSLYPTVMRDNAYPVGKYNFTELDVLDNEKQRIYIDRLTSLHAYRWQSKAFVCVSVECPKDIYIPFLMSRNEKGENIQDLNDKVRQVYFGVELNHAIVKLGYKVTKVHWVLEFQTTEYIFADYMKKFWDMKSKAKKGTTDYDTAKTFGNGLSGKYGQGERETETKIRVAETDPETGEEITPDRSEAFKFFHAEPIVDQDRVLAYITTEPVEKDWNSYPCYLSMAILAYSRIFMSNIILMFDGYKNPKNSPLYGDTDSIIVPNHVKPYLKPILGNEMGQLADELNGGKGITFTGLAPKTYNQIIVSGKKNLNNEHEVYSLTRCKGIPHSSDPKNYLKSIIPEEKDEKIAKLIHEFKDSPDIGKEIPIDDLGLQGIIYEYKNDDVENLYVNHLGHEIFNKILRRQGLVTAYFKTIRKNVHARSIHSAFSVCSQLSTRTLAFTDWWSSGKRRNPVVGVTEEEYYKMSTPIGFKN